MLKFGFCFIHQFDHNGFPIVIKLITSYPENYIELRLEINDIFFHKQNIFILD